MQEAWDILDYQSYHSGIEMGNVIDEPDFDKAINRTIVELKS